MPLTQKMTKVRLFAILLFFVGVLEPFPGMTQPWGSDYYIERWEQQVSGCGETEACCVREVQCMMETFSRISADGKDGNLYSPYPSAAMSTDFVWRPVRTHIASSMMSPHCPANLRRAGYDILTRLSSVFDVQDIIGESAEDSLNFILELEVAIGWYPPDLMNFLQCDTPAAQLTFPSDPDPTEANLRRAESAIKREDPLAAALYQSMLANAVLEPQQESRKHLLAAEIARLEGDDPLEAYRIAAMSADESGADTVLATAALPLRDAALAVEDAEEALVWQLHLATSKTRSGKIEEAVSEYAVAARLAQFLERPEESDNLFETAHALAADVPGGVILAQSLLQHLSHLASQGRRNAGCAILDRALVVFERESLTAEAALRDAEDKLNCEGLRALERLQSLMSAVDAAEARGDPVGVIAALDRAVEEVQIPIFMRPEGASARSSVYGARGWFHLLYGNPQQARSDTEAALDASPDEHWLQANLGLIDLLDGNVEPALTRLVPLFPKESGDGRSYSDVIEEDIRSLRDAGYPAGAFAPLEAVLSAHKR